MILSVSCSNSRHVGKLKGVRNQKLVETLASSQIDYDWFNAKIATDVQIADEKKSFKTIVKIRRDSVIWLSVYPLLGIEVSRIMITPDSIKVIDKINNTFFLKDYDYLKREKNINVDFSTIQDMLVANSLLFNPEDKFRSVKGETDYVITSKVKRKVRKAIGFQHKDADHVITKDTVSFDINEKKYKKALEKNTEEDLIIKRYWLSLEYNRIVRSMVSFVETGRVVEASYSDFQINKYLDNAFFPKKVEYTLIDQVQTMDISLKYNKVRIDKKQSFPFKIPDHFTKFEEK